MYDATVTPYGGLVLVVAETGYVYAAYDNLRDAFGVRIHNEGYYPRIIIWGINGVTGRV
jgi:hypothetical protein